MSRLFSIIVTLFILVLVYLWIGHISGRDDTGNYPAAEIVNEEEQTPSTQSTYREDAEQDISEEERTQNDDEYTEPAKPAATEESYEAKNPRPSASKGDHLVIVGNFLERSNAEKHLETVRNLGYPSAEILQFEISQYYTVCASRYDSPTEARRVARKIKEQHGIDAYMRTVN